MEFNQRVLDDLRFDFRGACRKHREYLEKALLVRAQLAFGPAYRLRENPLLEEWLIAAFNRLLVTDRLKPSVRQTLEGICTHLFFLCLIYILDRLTSEELSRFEFVARMKSSLKGADSNLTVQTTKVELLALKEAMDRYEKTKPQRVEIFELKILDGFSFEEIGKRLNMSHQNARYHFDEGMKDLARILTGHNLRL